MKQVSFALLFFLIFLSPSFAVESPDETAPQWQEIEIEFGAANEYANPYTDVDARVEFVHDDGTTITRPMFWDGDNTFRVRFASTKASGNWKWTSKDSSGDAGLDGKSGSLTATEPAAKETTFRRHGFWTIPTGGRNLIHADGTPRIMAADTPWALPWRATPEQAKIYATDRQEKGFNAALLMTMQPDRGVKGPRSRTQPEGFDVAFEDLPDGRLTKLNVDYFRKFDALVNILVDHGIAPVYQPVFHGYGWKGKQTAGNSLSPEDYARYCRYLVARFGARPAIWLLGGDGTFTDANVIEQLDVAGREVEKWDAYKHPTGIHYAPHSISDVHQDKDWLDFQWCQTGHNGEHVQARVADMWRNTPVKAIANGEPTYENIGRTGNAVGWWQGHEAWCNLTAGGTMGVVYGAASLWNWKLDPDETGHATWCTAPGAGWREALDFEGSKYPALLTKILDGLPIDGMQPNWTCTYGRRGLLVAGKLFVLYLPDGGGTAILSKDVPRDYRIFDPKTGDTVGQGKLAEEGPPNFDCKSKEPRVVVFSATYAER